MYTEFECKALSKRLWIELSVIACDNARKKSFVRSVKIFMHQLSLVKRYSGLRQRMTVCNN